ncbi:tRNA (adenosine(37)-N6)-dimethylallyltransferase MiaA [Pedobacter sp.]|uniref:tRNA (adenosine(37)-N6)-dimethylallyltransferase MiaA n=1 Tax=Pedobacter sp. TaxID=1411316 RepID=UPI003BAD25DB
MQNYNLIVILGATASGKTKLAVEVAAALDTEIISADSRQIFRGMDIGTGKDLNEYALAGRKIPYHLIDILDAGDRYHVDAFKNDFFEVFETLSSKQKVPILCGGTGLYIHSILQNQTYTAVPVNSELRSQLDVLEKDALMIKLLDYPNTAYVDLHSKKRLIRAIEIAEYLKYNEIPAVERPAIKPIIFGLKNEVAQTRENILHRLSERLDAGMIEEVEQLIKSGIDPEMLVFYGLEYKFIVNYLAGLLSKAELKEKLGIAICQYAKRQNTFFRKMEKDGVDIVWLNARAETNHLKQLILEKVL